MFVILCWRVSSQLKMNLYFQLSVWIHSKVLVHHHNVDSQEGERYLKLTKTTEKNAVPLIDLLVYHNVQVWCKICHLIAIAKVAMHSAQCNGTLHAPWLLTLHCATIKAVSFTRSRYIEQTTVKNLPSAATFQDINPPHPECLIC